MVRVGRRDFPLGPLSPRESSKCGCSGRRTPARFEIPLIGYNIVMSIRDVAASAHYLQYKTASATETASASAEDSAPFRDRWLVLALLVPYGMPRLALLTLQYKTASTTAPQARGDYFPKF